MQGREAAELLGPGGAVARALEARGARFEARAEQERMLRCVEEALSSGRHALIEAGTGVGKSFAYLLPALCWAQAQGKRVAVATSTISLQEQIVGKDLPLLAEALPFPVEFALVKGRGNYLCRRRMENARREAEGLFELGEGREQLARIARFAEETPGGSLQDLPFRPHPEVWEAVRAERGNCLGRRCPHYARCGYQRSRRRAHAAPLLVLNHHVLVADLALRRSGSSFLPEVDAVIIDEAHDFLDTAVSHLGLRVSARGTLRQIGRLWNPRRKRGLLARHEDGHARQSVERAREALADAMGELGVDLLETEGGGRTRTLRGALEDRVSPRLEAVSRAIAESARRAGDDELAMELLSAARTMGAAAEGWQQALAEGDEDVVRWAEVEGPGRFSLHLAPLAVGPVLDEVLWRRHESVILTSATLATGRPPDFGYLRGSLGLEDAECISVGSPFDFREQARVVVRDDLPPPGPSGGAYERALPGAVEEAVEATDGRAFVLFTSWRSLEAVAARLVPVFEDRGWQVLVQGGDLDRREMLARFRERPSVLFGVASFWQGVDVPGDALRHVIITRIPFEVPDHPLARARGRRLEQQGLDAFRALSLPQAALRLKQGFGRLIRSGSDRGRVTILDSRIATRAYGRQLLAGLPDCPVEFVSRSASAPAPPPPRPPG